MFPQDFEDAISIKERIPPRREKSSQGILFAILSCQIEPHNPRTTPAKATFQGQKKHWNGNVQAKARANNSREFEGTTHDNVGFRGKKGQKVHPNFAPNMTMEFHYHAFCAPELSGPISRDTAILSLRYPISRDTFSGRFALPQNGAIPPLGT